MTVKCESHPDAPLIEDHRAGDLICSDCGLVIGDRMIDVGSEWRTFSNDKDSKDMSRVGGVEDPTLEGADLTTSIGRATGAAGFDESGNPLYRNRNLVICFIFFVFKMVKNFHKFYEINILRLKESAAEKAKRKADREIKEMAERLSADQSITVCFIL
jgi:hypothetical protein